jgi:hypothetical protein
LGDPGKTDNQPYRTLDGINSVQLICGGRLRKFAQKVFPPLRRMRLIRAAERQESWDNFNKSKR